ncbi:MAG: DUF4336 domain-containing protein [Alphaproteobacteria bacterium]|nr:DUF4336 domain-containing protein [Alphaproteobacteria bacterium]
MTTLRPFGPNIWLAEGPTVSFFGFPYSTRMAAIKLSDGGLFIWSPVALYEELKREIDALGPVRFLVSPNKLHHLYLGAWKAAYPAARMFAPPGLRRRRKDLAFNGDLTNAPDSGWAADIDQVLMRGSLFMTEVVFFHRASGTVIFTDLIQNFPCSWAKGWRGLVMRLDGLVAPNPGAPREWRLSFLNRRAAREALQKILSWPIERVIIAHGDLPSDNAAGFVRKAFGWLL